MACYLWDMSFFCLLWIPLFYLFWRNLTGNEAFAGGVWAPLAGSIVALIWFFMGPIVDHGGFGISRWVSGCLDIIVLPALVPILFYLFLVCFKIISGNVNFANFALLWLIPGAAIKAISWSSQSDPILLVLVPILWTAIAVGIPFFAGFFQYGRLVVIIPASLGILVVPFAAACSYWAFFTQKSLWGFLFLFAAAAPMLVSLVMLLMKAEE